LLGAICQGKPGGWRTNKRRVGPDPLCPRYRIGFVLRTSLVDRIRCNSFPTRYLTLTLTGSKLASFCAFHSPPEPSGTRWRCPNAPSLPSLALFGAIRPGQGRRPLPDGVRITHRFCRFHPAATPAQWNKGRADDHAEKEAIRSMSVGTGGNGW
jgi:hypothetical protein